MQHKHVNRPDRADMDMWEEHAYEAARNQEEKGGCWGILLLLFFFWACVGSCSQQVFSN